MGVARTCSLLQRPFLGTHEFGVRSFQTSANVGVHLAIDAVRLLTASGPLLVLSLLPMLFCQAYIDFEISQGERQRTRLLYERLLDRTKHVKVWLSFARFEASPLPVEPEEEG